MIFGCHHQDIGEEYGQVKLKVGPAGTPQDPKEALLSQGKNAGIKMKERA